MEEDIEELKRLMKDEAKATRQLQQDLERIKGYMRVRLVVNIIWIIIALMPTLLAILYLPGWLAGVFK
jgi:hypothetical protein